MDRYFAAKNRLFTDLLSEGGAAIINLDDQFSAAIIDCLQDRAIVIKTFGYAEDADFRILSITPSGDGLDMKVVYR